MMFNLGPFGALGCEKIVAALTFVHWADPLAPVFAEETVHDAVFVHAGDDETADVGYERDPCGSCLPSSIAHWTLPGPWVAVSAGT